MVTILKRHLPVIALCVALAATSCHRPIGVLDEEEMVQFLIEAYQLEGFYAVESGYHYERMNREVQADYEELFAHHGLTPKKFERSIKYYLAHPEQYEAMHQRVVDTLDARIAYLEENADTTQEATTTSSTIPLEWEN